MVQNPFDKNDKFILIITALIDTGADMNCIQEGIIPSKYYKKTKEELSSASGAKLNIRYKLDNVHICNEGTCVESTFILVKNLSREVILGTPFITCIQPFSVDTTGITSYIKGKETARWQAILSVFDFDIEYIKGENNCVPDFLSGNKKIRLLML